MLGRDQYGTSSAAPISARAVDQSAYFRYLRGTAHLDPLLLDNVPFDDNNEASLRSTKFRKLGTSQGEFVEIVGWNAREDSRNTSTTQLLETLSRLDVNLLVESFFEVVHPVFPILNQQAFRESYQRRSVETVLLAAVCVVSGAWLSSTRRRTNEPNLSSTELLLREHLRASLDRPSIATLQAGLLLQQCPGHTSPQLASQLISAAFDLGLHQDCSDWMIDSQEKKSRRRLAWALYAQDKWTTMLHGSPAQMTEANWMVNDLLLDDFDVVATAENTENRNHGAILFMQMLVLSQLLANVLDTFYTLSAEAEVRSSAHDGLRVVLERAKPVQIKLKDWFSNLSPDLKMDAQDESQAAYNGILHLAYFATEIALHRCIIRASVAPGTDTYVAHICRSAAKTRLISAMDFVNRLRPLHFKFSWPLASISHFGLIGSFGVLLRATAPTREEASFYRARLEEYRWTLSVSSRSADFLDSAIHLLDTSTELIQYIPERPEMTEFVSMNPRAFGNGGSAGQASSASRSSVFNHAPQRPSDAFEGFSSPESSTSSDEDVEDAESI